MTFPRLLIIARHRRHVVGAIALTALLSACGGAARAQRAAPSASPSPKVIAAGLDQPKKLTLTSGGDLLVALSGDGAAPTSCTDGDQRSCLDRSGAIDEVTPAGRATTLLRGLPSVSSGHSDPQATGPVQARFVGGGLQVLFQNTVIEERTGNSIYGRAGRLFSDLVTFSSGGDPTPAIEARLGPFEARHDPDRGAGSDVTYGEEAAVDSDPYGFVAYHGGYAIADAGGNDVLFLSPAGRLSVLAVLPTIRERAPAHTFGARQTTAIEAEAQAVPTAVAVGPDGALYVGELGGVPSARGSSDVYRIAPGHAPTVYARGLTAIGDLAFDSAGRLLVLEIDRDGLNDPGIDDGHPVSGAIVAVSRDGARTMLVGSGLSFPTALAVAPGGTVYVSTYGTTSAGSGRGGEIVALHLG